MFSLLNELSSSLHGRLTLSFNISRCSNNDAFASFILSSLCALEHKLLKTSKSVAASAFSGTSSFISSDSNANRIRSYCSSASCVEAVASNSLLSCASEMSETRVFSFFFLCFLCLCFLLDFERSCFFLLPIIKVYSALFRIIYFIV